MIFNRIKTKNISIKIAGFFAIGFISIQPIHAFVPYIYEPKSEELKKTGVSIGKTAAQLLQLEQAKEAEKLASLAVRLQPNDDRLWTILAESQLRTNNLKDAIQSIARAKRINPNKAGLWFAEASLYLRQNQIIKAIYLLEKGLKIDPNNPGAYFQLGNAQVMQGKLHLALKSYKKASSLNPNFWEAINNQSLILYEINKKQKAIDLWRDVLKITNNAEPLLGLATGLYEKNIKNRESIDLAKEALANNPNYVSTEYQKEQLWGKKLQKAAKLLLSDPLLKSAVQKAMANSN